MFALTFIFVPLPLPHTFFFYFKVNFALNFQARENRNGFIMKRALVSVRQDNIQDFALQDTRVKRVLEYVFPGVLDQEM